MNAGQLNAGLDLSDQKTYLASLEEANGIQGLLDVRDFIFQTCSSTLCVDFHELILAVYSVSDNQCMRQTFASLTRSSPGSS